MMWVFFLSMYSITCRKYNASISNFRGGSL
ncbi:hypothetical protein FWK35_00004937 [Aphis craccivora]|uniref:Uncharacterized protein n=1 Tax=Aphis craccivora TaxID=307492 RepID=A0A6G0ZFW6_APHCR|nr:hypothetical protein FWK35_00004937 [Aphis craccivora]